MATPKWMLEDIQKRVDSGSLDYNLLNEGVKKSIKPKAESPIPKYKAVGVGDVRAVDKLRPPTLAEQRQRDEPFMPESERVAQQTKDIYAGYDTVGYNVGEDPGYNALAKSEIGKAIAPKTYAVSEGATLGLTPKFEDVFKREKTFGESALGFAGEALPIFAGSGAASKLLPKASPYLRTSLVGGAYGGAKEAFQGGSAGDVAKEATLNAALFPATELGINKLVIPGAKALVGKVGELLPKRAPVEAPLPEPLPKVEPRRIPVRSEPKQEYTIYRRDVEGAILDAENKPHGLYTSLVKDKSTFESPHLDAGNTDYWGVGKPSNPLIVEEANIKHARFGSLGSGDASAGISALKRLLPKEEFALIPKMGKQELIEILNREFPGADYNRYFDAYELMEVYGSQLAKKRGYDAVILEDKKFPEFSEYISLKNNAVDFGLPTPQLPKATNLPEGMGLNRSASTTVKLPKPGNDLLPGGPTVGLEPGIPVGMKERGVSQNVRTDANRPDVLRDSISVNPDTYKQLGNAETLAKAQAVFDEGLEPAITKLNELIDTMQPEAAPLVKMIADKLSLEGNVARARELLSNAAVKATQAGQFGQAFRILRDADPATLLMTMEKQLKNLNKEGLKAYGKKWKDFDLTPGEMDLISKVREGDQAAFDGVMEQIQTRIANEMPATAMEKINAWRHISMLLNPKTHIRNVAGNTIMMGMRRSAQRVSGLLQKVLPQSERTQAVFVNKEYKDMAKQYFEANKKDLLSGANKYQENLSLNMPDKRVFKTKPLEKVRKFNYWLLQKGDNPFFQDAYVDRLASYAQAKGIKDPFLLKQEAFDIALKEAEEATYKDANAFATFINGQKRTDASTGKLGNIKAGLLEAALPFTKTPSNIIMRVIDYSPAGIIKGLDNIESAKGLDDLAKGLTGTGIMVLGYYLAKNGILTGKASSDTDLRAYDANTGNSPFSVLGKYTYDWAQPFAVPFTVGVEIYNALKDSAEDKAKMDKLIANKDTSKFEEMAKSIGNGLLAGFEASGDTVFNMSVMKGIKSLIGSDGQSFVEGAAKLPGNYATQFIPTLSGQLAGTLDQTVRQTYVPGDLPETFKNTVKAKIPGLSKSLPAKQTPFGQDVKRPEGLPERAFSQFLSPSIVSIDQGVDPKIDAELRRLNKLGFTKQFPTMVKNYVEGTQKYPKIMLTPEETTQYQKRTGQLTQEAFNKLLNQPNYVNAKDYVNVYDPGKNKTADEIRAELLAKAIEEAKATAKAEIVKSKGYKK